MQLWMRMHKGAQEQLKAVPTLNIGRTSVQSGSHAMFLVMALTFSNQQTPHHPMHPLKTHCRQVTPIKYSLKST